MNFKTTITISTLAVLAAITIPVYARDYGGWGDYSSDDDWERMTPSQQREYDLEAEAEEAEEARRIAGMSAAERRCEAAVYRWMREHAEYQIGRRATAPVEPAKCARARK